MPRSPTSETVSKRARRSVAAAAPPLSLLHTQKWFASIIILPLRRDNKLPDLSPSGQPIRDEAKRYIAPSPTLKPHQRIEIYHQQYWWRLLKCLQENFPMLTRLFGYREFNQAIGIPYLTFSAPTHWSLAQLGRTLPAWIRDHYREEDQDLILAAVTTDWTAQAAFCAKQRRPIRQDTFDPRTTCVALQPHVHLLAFPADILSLREALLAHDADYWTSAPFPELAFGDFFFVVYRTLNNQVAWKKISFGEYRMLQHLKEGLTIQSACEKMEKEPKEIVSQAEQEMPFWFREWTAFQWLTHK